MNVFTARRNHRRPASSGRRTSSQLTPNMTLVQTQNQGTPSSSSAASPRRATASPRSPWSSTACAMANPVAVQPGAVRHREHRGAEGPAGRALRPQRDRRRDHHHDASEPADEFEGTITAGYDSGPGYTARLGVSGPIGRHAEVTGCPARTSTPTATSTIRSWARRPIRSRTCPAACKLRVGAERRLPRPTCASTSRDVDTQALYFNITEQRRTTPACRCGSTTPARTSATCTASSLKLDFGLGGGTLTSVTAYDTLEEILTGDQFDFLPIPESVLFQFFGADQAQHQFLDVEAVSQELRFTSPAETGCAGSSAPTSSRPTASSRPATWSTSATASCPVVKRDAAAAASADSDSSPSSPTRRTTSPGRCSANLTYDLTDQLEGSTWRCATTRTSARTRPRRPRSSCRPARRPAFHRPGPQGHLGRAAAEGDAALQADRRR